MSERLSLRPWYCTKRLIELVFGVEASLGSDLLEENSGISKYKGTSH